MKIGVVRQRYVASGGAERYLHAVVRELMARGQDVHVFARAWERGAPLNFHRVPVLPVPAFLRALSFAWWSRRVVRRARCDLIFSLERTLQQDVYRAGDGCHREWLVQRQRYLPAWKSHTLRVNPLHATLLALEKQTFSPRNTGWIIANSRRGKEEIVRHFGFPEERIHVVYTGVDSQRFKPRPRAQRSENFVLLFVGTGFERKGLRFCVQALAQLPSHFKLNVVGKGDTTPYRRLAHRLGVAERIEFLGANLDTAEVYPEADLLVHPAIYEPFANVCLEAMACGLPVVTSRISGTAEIIEHGRNGAVVERPENIEELVRAIQLFEEPRARAAASQQARMTAEAHSFSEHVTRTLEILELARARRQVGESLASASPR
jgi:UDP-glucose:(heptosyl)LPS alpha-1,3-glucosyltransferase